jgi:hypothetical protein
MFMMRTWSEDRLLCEQELIVVDFVESLVPVCSRRDGLEAAETKSGLKAKLLWNQYALWDETTLGTVVRRREIDSGFVCEVSTRTIDRLNEMTRRGHSPRVLRSDETI